MKYIISCEHASNRVPRRFAHVFHGEESILASHRAYDPGAAALARKLANSFNASLHTGVISRLLVDLNRSPTNNRSLFSGYSRMLSQSDRELLLQKYYFPYRKMVEGEVGEIIARGRPVLHFSIHTFAPVKDSKERMADVGLLYDPARKREKEICAFLGKFLHKEIMSLRVRRNYPYLGTSDGLTAFMRKLYTAEQYTGIEIEMNQALLLPRGSWKKNVVDGLIKGFSKIEYFQ